MKVSSDDPTEPQGDHAKERLDEFISERFPGGLPPEESPLEETVGADGADESEDAEPLQPPAEEGD
jgi:hypothetical protein